MRFLLLSSIILAATFSTASRLVRRVSTPVVDDGIILNYSLTIEFLQRAFYKGGLDRFSRADFVAAGYADPFHDNLCEIYADEEKHVAFLMGALRAAGMEATVELTYSFPYDDVQSFVTLANVLEGVGVSAYLGAAASLVDKDYLTASGSILATEARHSSYLQASQGESPFPNAFDTPLDFNEVHSLAVMFITVNPNPTKLPFQAFPTLTLQCTDYYYEADRSSLTFTGAFKEASKLNVTESTPIYALAVRVRITAGNTDYKVDRIPASAMGQVYIVLSRSDKDFSDENIVAGPAIIEVYPRDKIPTTPHSQCT